MEMCFCISKNTFQALNLSSDHSFAPRCEPVISPAGIVIVSLFRFLHQALIQQFSEIVVKRTGAELVLIVRLACDLLHDPVAVAIFIGKRNQDMKRGGRKR